MKLILSAALLALPLVLFSQTTINGNLEHDGVTRQYRLYIPASYQGTESWPLVLNLHGAGSNAIEQEFYSQMDKVADTAQFLVCYPDGLNNLWNVGWTMGSTADDVGFLSSLIDQLMLDYQIDPNRVYSCGMSNGGFMSYRLACELNQRIAAIASVTGSMVPSNLASCQPSKPVPVMEIHGTADLVVPYNGLANLCIPVDSVVAFWTNNNYCDPSFTQIDLPDSNPLDGCTVTRFDYNDCADNSKVSLLRVNGGGHTWPGASLTVGVTNRDIAASEEIWLFFRQFSLDIPAANEIFAQKSDQGFLFPNPSAGMIYFNTNFSLEGLRYKVIDSSGKSYLSGQFTGEQPALDVSAIPEGIYSLLINDTVVPRIYRFLKM